MNDLSLPERIVCFGRFLTDHGFKIFSTNLIDSLRSLEDIDILNQPDFFFTLRANLTHTKEEWRLFPALYAEYWRDMPGLSPDVCYAPPEAAESEELLADDRFQETAPGSDQNRVESDDGESKPIETYSPFSGIKKKDLSRFDKADIHSARLALTRLISPFKISTSRRFKHSGRPGNIDFRRMFKKSIKLGGLPLDLTYRKKKTRLKKLVVLADISGSMERYTRFIVPFLLGLSGVKPRAEVFVFSTALTRITPSVRKWTVDAALDSVFQEVRGWSGGTRIGFSLAQFNQRYGQSLLNKRTVAVIISDGWDLGERDLLRREMAHFRRKVHTVIWLNPLAGDPNYEPICTGMQTALPFVDFLLAADTIQNLDRAGRKLSRLIIH